MKAILRVLFVAIVVMIGVSACGPSADELYQQGIEYYNNKDYSKAIECFTNAANQGHEESKKYLAMIVEGKAPEENIQAAEEVVEVVDDEENDEEELEEVFTEIDDEEDEEEEPVAKTETVVNKKTTSSKNQVTKEETPKPVKATSAFTISSSKRVYFAKGNLQYNPSAKKWRIADNQWDVIGDGNKNISDKYNGWLDLFGWGTGANPTNSSTTNKDYGTFSDWGKNSISNGGGNKWRTLTKEEWEYVLETRSTPSGVRYAKATVNDVKGVILLPDNWNVSYYGLENTNKSGGDFDDNIISKSDWATKFEAKGAVFLPNAGSRNGNKISGLGKDGYYWSASSFDSSGAFAVYIYDRNVNSGKHYYDKNGFSVRLVRNAN